jgi:TolB protein
VERAPLPGPSCPQWIVFHSFRPGNLDIFRLDGVEGGSGANLINLSNNSAVDSRPSRSPNDKFVVFQSNRDGNVELYMGDTEGKNQSRLTNTNANNINAMVGPDNQSVIFQSDRNGNWDVYIIDTDGTERQLTTNAADDTNPFWSPDKEWITFQSNRSGTWNVYLLNVSTGTEYTVTDAAYDVVFPSWSPNGQQLAFLADWGGNWDLYVSDLRGENVKRITSQGNAGNVSWSPDGNKIAFQLGGDEVTDVFTYDLTSGKQYQLTTFAGPDSAPTWDCGGANISFTSLSSGNLDLFSVPWQGGEISYITNNPSSDKWSEWSPSKEFASRGY